MTVTIFNYHNTVKRIGGCYGDERVMESNAPDLHILQSSEISRHGSG